MPPFKHVVLLGPTGSGKSQLALAIARLRNDFEVVSVDAMTVYRGMNIGTAKPTLDEQREIRHHLVDIVDPSDDYTVARFQTDLATTLRDIEARDRRALLVGGTGLYVRAAVDGLAVPPQFPDVRAEIEAEPDTAALHRRLEELDPKAATKMQPNNRRRIVRALEVCVGSGRPFSSYGPGLDAYGPTSFRQIGLWPSRDALNARVDTRFRKMIDEGLVDEVRNLGELSRTARQALGYRQILEHIEHDAPLAACIDEAIRVTKQFARRQRVWFRRDPRIAWLPPTISQSDVASAL